MKFPLQDALLENLPKIIQIEELGQKNREISDIVKKEFDDTTLNIIRDERIYPDLVGFVQKNPSKEKEIIIVEVKDEPITLKMVEQTRFYSEVFNATFAFLISTKGIEENKVRFLLKKPKIRAGIIIAKFKETGSIEINKRFKETTPEFLHMYLRPREYESKQDKSSGWKNRFFNVRRS